MEIIIVGAGIGGLSAAIALSQAGHKVTVLEAASALAEVGAGVQLTPVASKHVYRWGLGDDLLAEAALPESFRVRDGLKGSILGSVEFGDFEKCYGAPYIVLHRADIHRILHQHALKAGAVVKVNCRVVEYDFEAGSVMLANGETYSVDLVVAADGINSFARRTFLPGSENGWLSKSGWAAYRAVAAVDELKTDKRTAEVVSSHVCNCFVGSRTSLMTYMVKNSRMLNLVLSHPDDVDTSDWTAEDFRKEVTRLTEGWDPCVRTIIASAKPSIQNWPIHQVESLPRWVSSSGKFALMGDAAHAMAFYLSMGVSMAVEDAAALEECLRLCTRSKISLSSGMKVFETVRKQRAEAVRDASLHAGKMLMLPNGHDRELRDAALKTGGETCDDEGDDRFYASRLSYGIVDKKIRDWGYAYDVVAAIRADWKKQGLEYPIDS